MDMSELTPVTIYEGENAVFFESPSEFFIKVNNTVIPNPEDLWEVTNGKITVPVNEGSAKFVQPFFEPELTEVATGDLEYITQNGDFFIVGESDNIPGYSNYYLHHPKTNNIYEVIYKPFNGEQIVTDDFLEFSGFKEQAKQFETPVLVENHKTGVRGVHGVNDLHEKVGESFQYLLRVRE